MKQVFRMIVCVLGLVWSVMALVGVVLALLLMVVGETIRGRVFALTALLLCPSLFMIWFSWFLAPIGRRKWQRIAGVLFASGLVLTVFSIVIAPPGRSSENAAIQSVYNEGTSYKKWSIANLVPEVDQIKLGSYLIPLVDPFMDTAQAKRVRQAFLNVYGPMRKDINFKRLGSVLDSVYLEVLLGIRGSGHLYVYIPETEDNTPLPVMLFLHGSMGNFKGALWIWKQFADEYGFAIVAPTFGAGNWDEKGGPEAISAARQYCVDDSRMDGNNIYLAGLSNGGLGVGKAGAASPEAYRGLIFISAVTDKSTVGSETFLDTWARRPVLVLHGEKDQRVPIAHAWNNLRKLYDRSDYVTTKRYERKDHFLFFSSRSLILDDIAAWMGR